MYKTKLIKNERLIIFEVATRLCRRDGEGSIKEKKADANESKTRPLVTPCHQDFRPRHRKPGINNTIARKTVTAMMMR